MKQNKYQCEISDCKKEGAYFCADCDMIFCPNHGQIGGDREEDEIGWIAVPSLCDECLNKKGWKK